MVGTQFNVAGRRYHSGLLEDMTATVRQEVLELVKVQ
jgi:hypothetical protein